jgi:hypothetical protein
MQAFLLCGLVVFRKSFVLELVPYLRGRKLFGRFVIGRSDGGFRLGGCRWPMLPLVP